MNLGDVPYDKRRASGFFTRREIVQVAGVNAPLSDLASDIQDARRKAVRSDQIQIEDLIGLLRYEADKLEMHYIEGLEHNVRVLSEMSDEEVIQALIERKGGFSPE